ncbi:MAG: hypothetical protein ACD_5C00095G0003 [uncultured bacterium]|nr:MAG: hypothetical protein ACD_5C00095G0003 [uncultured bacterium]
MPIIEDIKEKIMQRLQSVLDEGFGELIIRIQDHKVVHMERKFGEKV